MNKSALFSFTPSLMDGETLEAIFVQREALAADLVERIRESVLTQNKLHTLIIGARGMGKTHLVSLVHHRIQAMDDLKERLLIAWLREEEWGVTSFLDLLLRIFRALAEGDSTVEGRMEGLFNLSSEEAEAAGTRLLNELIGERTLLLIAENLDDLFIGLGEQGQKQLRAFLQTYSNCTVLATSPRLFSGVQQRSKPFYGFFRPLHLTEITTQEAQQLLVNIAQLREQTDLVHFLQSPTGQARIRAIQHLAGGNPRIYIIFADFLTHQSLDDLAPPFMSLVDVLTPYYQSRMQYLSPQQRKIVELLCEKKAPQPVKTIAQRCFMTSQTTSSQLKELKEKGYVKSEVIGRESFYEITEALMRMCLGVKKERGEPLRLMVDFLRVWYPKDELQAMQQTMLTIPSRSTLMRRYIEQALEESKVVDEDPRIHAYLDEIKTYSDQGEYNNALKVVEKLIQAHDSSIARSWYSTCLNYLHRYQEALESEKKVIDRDPSDYRAWANYGYTLLNLESHEEAIISFSKAIELNPLYTYAWTMKGSSLVDLGKNEEAIDACNEALEIDPSNEFAWAIKGMAYYDLELYEESIYSYEEALKINPYDAETWCHIGMSLSILEHHEEAIIAYRKALDLNSEYDYAWVNLGLILSDLCNYKEAVSAFDKGLSIDPGDSYVWDLKGDALYNLGLYMEAICSYNKALELNSDYDWIEQKKLKSIAVLMIDLNHWNNNKMILELLNKNNPSRSRFIEIIIQVLLTIITDSKNWKNSIVRLLDILEDQLSLTQLSAALVKTISELTSEFTSQAKATAWRDAWAEVVGHKPEFELPLRLLNTALHYKQKPDDPRVFLQLPTEERKILQQALGLDQSLD